MTPHSTWVTGLMLALTLIASPPLQAAGGHAADDELALIAAQLSAETLAPGTPSGVSVSATLVDPADCINTGSWSPVINWTPHIPVSAANLPDGRILTFASNQRTTFPVGREFTYAATWNPATGAFKEFNHTSHDMFCGGMTLMADGRVMVNGGRNEVTSTSVFDWRTNSWTRLQNMNGGRWYNTTVSLPNGSVFTATGSGTGINTTERWSTAGWTVLTGISWPAVTSLDAGYMKEWHPFVSVAPDGRLLHFGPTDTLHWFNTTGTGSFTNANASIPGTHYPKEGCWVMYDEGKMLVAGGGINPTPSSGDSTIGISSNAAYTVNMSTNPPVVSATASMKYSRQFVNTVVLPSGEVLVIGGNNPGQKFSDVGSVLPCEIWNPRTGNWRTVASISVPRNYHSVALLLPDGRVWSAGGGLGGGDHRDAQLYSPPCFFTNTGALATRPALNTAPSKIGPGSTFSVTGTAGLVKFSFIRMATVTHSVNTDQRYLSLPFIESSAGNYQITAHSNLNVMTPGHWMLFGINSTGAFSVAKIIQIEPSTTLFVTNPGGQSSNVGTAVSLQISATGSGLTYTASGLPPGLSLDASNGLITGTPTTSGIFSTRITAAASGQAVSQDFTWTVLLTKTGTGDILREWWLNIPNSDLNSLINHTAYPDNPNGSDQLTSFETPSNWAENSGQRVRGFIVPPVTGPYRFWIASDDEGQLLLSTNNDPANSTVIARCAPWVPAREWTKYPEQTSAFITLQAGQPYYIEAIMKEGGGNDHLAVAWLIPNTSEPAIIAGQYLSPWQSNHAPALTSPGNLTSVIANAITITITASDADNDALTYDATGLPDGLTIDNATGIIIGTPNTTGTFNVTISVTDHQSSDVTASFVWTINSQVELAEPSPTAPKISGSTITYTASSTGGLNVRYLWNWGDGTPNTGFSSSQTATHTYASPGRFQITLTASDDTGRITTSTFYQAISAPLTALRPTSSSSIILEDLPADASDRLWSVNADNNSVSVFDTVTHARLAEINVGTAPRTLALAPDHRVWVSNVESSTISIISSNSLDVVQTITLARGSRPFGIAFDPDGTDAWIACEGSGELLRMNPVNGAQVAALKIGADARHVSVSADSARVFVTRFITPPLPGESTASIITNNTSGGELFCVLTSTLSIEKKTVLLHSERADTITTGRGIPNYLGPAIVSPDGLSAWVPSKQDNIKRGMLRDGRQLTHDQTIRSIASRIPLNDGTPDSTDDTTHRVDFDNAGIAVNAAFDPNGIYLFTALEGSREVGVIDVWNKKEIRRFTAGRAPQGIALSPDGRTVYVHNFMDRTITIHDASGVIDGQDTVPTLTATLKCITTEQLAADVLLGKQHFYDSADPRIAFQQYISCASCHNDGGQDGRVWDFTGIGEGLRNTITLRGHGGTAQGPVHWTGNFDEIQDFENQLRTLPLGTGLIAGAAPHAPLATPNAGRSNDLDSLAQYVSSLTLNDASTYQNSDGTLTASAQAGKIVFNNSSCASCHGGQQFTDSALNVLHDIGTLKPMSGQRLGGTLNGIDTPTLRGIWNTSPYLHDGSASTLEAAILAHTNTPRPDAGSQAMNDLVNYLMQIDDNEPSPAPGSFTATLSTDSSIISSQTFTVTLTFSAPVPTVTNSELETSNCTIEGITGSGTTWVATLRIGSVGAMSVRYISHAFSSNTLNLTIKRTQGLAASYFAGANFEQLRLNRIDATIDNTWQYSAPDALLPPDKFSVRWIGKVVPRHSEPCTFITTSDDGVRLWVNNVLLIDQWNAHGTAQHGGNISLTAGVPYEVKMEFFENSGSAIARLEWESSHQAREVIPAERLFIEESTLIANQHPITFAQWQSSGRVDSTGPLADSDGDGDLDLLEYALGTSPSTGVQLSSNLRIEQGTAGEAIVSCVRPAGLADVQLVLEGSSDLRTWATETLIPFVTDLGDGFQQVAWSQPAHHILRLRVIHSSGVSAVTTPVAIQRLSFNPGIQTVGISTVRASVFAGVIEAVSASTLLLRDNASLTAAVAPGARYYLEIRDGSYAGHRIDVQSIGDNTLTLDTAAVCNTLSFIPSDLAGASVVVRPHVTLGTALAPDRLLAGSSATTSDQVLLFQNGAYISYWLSNGGNDASRRGWLRVGDASLTVRNDLIIPPGTGMMLKNPSGARNWWLAGEVRTNSFAQRLASGHNLIASPWPVDQSPATLGLTLPGSATGGRNSLAADQLQHWNSDFSTSAQGFTSYWLLDNNARVRRWVTVGDATFASADDALILPSSRSMFYKAQPSTAARTLILPMP